MKVTQGLHLQARHTSSHRHTSAKRIVQAVHLQAGHMPTKTHRHKPTQKQTKLYKVCICTMQATQTDDEAEESPCGRRRRPTDFGCGGLSNLRVVQFVGCPICGLSNLWVVQFGWVVQFVGCPICGLSNLWVVQFVGCPICGLSNLLVV